MPLTATGRRWMLDRFLGTSVAAVDGAGTFIGVGDSSAAFAEAQTDLQAASNKFRKLVSSAPTRSGDVLTYIVSYTTGEANFTWAEIGAFSAVSAGTMFWRFVQALGAKASGTWTLTTTQTFTST